jgi:peptidoglycan/LPS O-acetylase OafA/YrhL
MEDHEHIHNHDEEDIDWAGPRPLRLATVLSFVPAFPLCLAHGVASHTPVPAVGLVPLAFSAGLGVALLGKHLAHPAAIFGADIVLATSLMIVLVFTWIESPMSGNAGLSMLASYATIPLLVSLYVSPTGTSRLARRIDRANARLHLQPHPPISLGARSPHRFRP